MTNAQQAIASENQRRRIPDRWLIEFNDMTDAELAWFADNADGPQTRAWCGWELEYRESFGISVSLDAEGNLARSRR